ncbi:AFG1 ATPase [Trifolium repens]|nr:AFG1 ATPase [Trifolium repens]
MFHLQSITQIFHSSYKYPRCYENLVFSITCFLKHKGLSDPLEVVAGEISDEAILVSTSNRAPDNLYEGGLQRDLFLPFIATLKDRCVSPICGKDILFLVYAEKKRFLFSTNIVVLMFKRLNGLSTNIMQLTFLITSFPENSFPAATNQTPYFETKNGNAGFPFATDQEDNADYYISFFN